MKLLIIHIVLIFIFTPKEISAQILDPPFKLKIKNPTRNIILEEYITNKDTIDYVIVTKATNYDEIRIISSVLVDDRLISVLNLFTDRLLFESAIFPIDLDRNNLKELIFYTYNPSSSIVSLKYWNPLNNPDNTETLLQLQSDSKSTGIGDRLWIKQLDEKFFNSPAILIMLSEGYPSKNSIRSIICMNPINKKIYWKRNFAQHITTSPIISSNKLLISGDAVDNGFVYYRGKNYIIGSNKEMTLSGIDQNDSTYYTDTKYLIALIDLKTGKSLVEKQAGHTLDRIHLFPTIDSLKVLGLIRHRMKASKIGSELFLFDVNNLSMKKLTNFSSSQISTYRKDSNVYFIDESTLYSVNINNYSINNLPVQIGFNPIFNICDSTSFANTYPTYFINNSKQNIILDNNLDEISKLDNSFTILNYLPGTNRFQLKHGNDFYLAELQKLNFWERISYKTYFVFSAGLGILVFVVLVLWLYTMRVSRNKILEQKMALEEATAKLIQSEKLAVLGTIAGGIAHELNSPLGAIINASQRLKYEMTSLEKNANFRLLTKAALRTKNIAEKFLVSTRSSNNDQDECEIQEVLDDILQILQRQFELLDIKILNNIKDNFKLKIGYTELNQIFTNLLTNSRDSMIDISKEKIIKIDYKIDGKYCYIYVKDTGNGFSDFILEKPFFAFNTTKPVGKGTGLGLWVIKKIIDKANGSIEIGNYEMGAFVNIKIPMA